MPKTDEMRFAVFHLKTRNDVVLRFPLKPQQRRRLSKTPRRSMLCHPA
jgi:hypothetical protein